MERERQMSDKDLKTIWLVIPCYNEKEVLPETSKQLQDIMEGLVGKGKINKESRVAFVNDGSKDTTWEIIARLHRENPLFVGINLAHNRGHQNALFAGLMTAKEYADAAISLDADLQDDVAAIEEFIDKFLEGKDIVYGVRSTRATDTLLTVQSHAGKDLPHHTRTKPQALSCSLNGSPHGLLKYPPPSCSSIYKKHGLSPF